MNKTTRTINQEFLGLDKHIRLVREFHDVYVLVFQSILTFFRRGRTLRKCFLIAQVEIGT